MGRLLDIAKAALAEVGAPDTDELPSISEGMMPTPVIAPANEWQARVSTAERPCFHCGGRGACDCISCGRYVAHMVWTAGLCLPCEARKRQGEHVQ